MSRPATEKTVTAALVVLPDTAPAGLYSLLEVFSSVGTAWEDLTGKPASEIRINVDLVAEKNGVMHCSMGVPVTPDATFSAASGYDFVIVPDMQITSGMDPRGQWPLATEWIRKQSALGAIVGSICTGALLLAETGLLDDLEVSRDRLTRRS
jgi:transcriptional regulator GlxA family with amidase domain